MERGININSLMRFKRNDYFIITDNKDLFRDFSSNKIFKQINDIKDNIEGKLFILYFTTDDLYTDTINKIIKINGKYITPEYFKKSIFFNANNNAHKTINNLREISEITKDETIQIKPPLNMMLNLSAGGIVHGNICQAIEQTKNLEGDYVEIGVYRGSSALTALKFMENCNINRKSYLIDTYDGFNYDESENSADILWKNTHKLWGTDKTMEKIDYLLKKNIKEPNFKLIKSNICKDNLPEEIKKIACANIDVDLQEATRDAIKKIGEKIVKGGIMILEDPTSTPSLIGAFYEMENFLKTETGKKFMKLHLIGQYFLIKIYD